MLLFLIIFSLVLLGTLCALELAQLLGHVRRLVVAERVPGAERFRAHGTRKRIRVRVQFGMVHDPQPLHEQPIAAGETAALLVHIPVVVDEVLECVAEEAAVGAGQDDHLADQLVLLLAVLGRH